MTLFEFVMELRDDIRRFEADWVASNKDTPEAYPMEMGAGEWFEQFISETWDSKEQSE